MAGKPEADYSTIMGGGKGNKLKELEAKAREFEVLGNVDLDKLLGLIEKKEKRI